ncbi:hypothetical protein [uncultured Polaribacter sp.]|uniref:hypothetical protein n=1 Tax=uncultured Polaribacter sp. TaxID=174711 RepID=UPI00261E19E0|nr:hypothetical protein [uncultured Polaribacter sp.]
MKYIIWDKENNPLTAQVSILDKKYFKDYILSNLKPINEIKYIEGFSALLHTLAKSSYILFNENLYWIVEWNPGLIILEMNKKEKMSFTALRSPNPKFGGRKPLEIDKKNIYDEDAENHQYNLIFNAWDAQFDKRHQEWNNFEPAHKDEVKLFHDCLKYVNKLGDLTQSKFEKDFKNYFENAKNNIEKWSGIGIITR